MAFNFLTAFKDAATDERFIREAQEIIRSSVFTDNINNAFTIVPNIKGRQQIVVARDIEKISRKEDGCNSVSINPDIPALSQEWDPTRVKVNIKKCYTEFEGAFTQWQLANGYDVHNIEEATFATWLVSFYVDAMTKDLNRVVLMGDEDIAVDPILKDAVTDEQNYDFIKKGLVPTLQQLQADPAFTDNIVTYTQNYATGAQYVFADGDVRNLLCEVTDTADYDANQLFMDRSSYRAYRKEFQNPGVYPLDSTARAITNGLADLSFDGIPIRWSNQYDRSRKNDFQGLVADVLDPLIDTHLPHFLCYTDKSNLQVGVDSLSALSDLTLEYIGGDDESFYMKGNYMLDFKIPNPYNLKAAI